jgi:hypothetical protein
VALLEKRGFLYNHSGDFPQVILIVPSHVPNMCVRRRRINAKCNINYDTVTPVIKMTDQSN